MNQILYACLILLPLGISLRASLRLLYGARGPQAADPIYQIMNVLGWTLTLTPLVVLLVVGTSWLSWLLLLVAGTAGVEMVVARREMQRQTVWALLSGSLSGRQLEPEALRRYQSRFTGIVGRVFRKLVTALENGVNLRSAIDANKKALPREALAFTAIDRGKSGQSGPASAVHDSIGTLQSSAGASALASHPLLQSLGYIATVIIIMLGIVSFVMYKIVPSYQDIFDDFRLQLPRTTMGLIFFSNAMVTSFFAVLLIGSGLAVLFGLFAVICYLCDIPVLQPITDRLFFSRHRSLVLKLLASAADNGQSFAATIEQLTGGRPRYPSRIVRRRLEQAGKAIVAGLDWKEALCTSAFIKRSDLAMLNTAQAVGNLSWVLRLLADQKVRSMNFRWSMVEQIAFPCAILLLGLLVLWICVALFLPLVNLIYGLL